MGFFPVIQLLQLTQSLRKSVMFSSLEKAHEVYKGTKPLGPKWGTLVVDI